eukprot:scaffold29029_cov73-Isochrysis_galbana.AAC.3
MGGQRTSRRNGSPPTRMPAFGQAALHLVFDALWQHGRHQLPCAADEGRRVDHQCLAEGRRVVGGEGEQHVFGEVERGERDHVGAWQGRGEEELGLGGAESPW